jgi:hypothetical protein
VDVNRFAGHDKISPPCPDCDSALVLDDVCFAGMPILVDAHCPGCRRRYWLHWPTGHALLHPVIVDAASLSVHVDGKPWYAKRVLRCLGSRDNPVQARITVRGDQARDRAILVNCLDFLYGHALLKLLSAPRHLRDDPDADVVVIAPSWLSWLLPGGSRVVEVDVPLRRGDEWIDGLDDAVSRVLAGYRSVAISPAVSQPQLRIEDLKALGPGLSPARFWDGTSRPPHITFIIRDDRLWLGERTPALAAARRLLPAGRQHDALRRRQHHRFAMVARLLRRHHPELVLSAVGVGARGGLPAYVNDMRMTNPGLDDELSWLATYRESHVVVGIHGSNMLLPSAVAGAVVDLLPRQKLQDIAEDLILSTEDTCVAKLSLFRYRILPETTSPAVVADTIGSILQDASFHYRNVIENSSSYQLPGWTRPISWRPLEQPAARR